MKHTYEVNFEIRTFFFILTVCFYQPEVADECQARMVLVTAYGSHLMTSNQTITSEGYPRTLAPTPEKLITTKIKSLIHRVRISNGFKGVSKIRPISLEPRSRDLRPVKSMWACLK